MVHIPIHLRRPGHLRIVLVHGFGQAGLVWSEVAQFLHHDFEVLALDLPGHGGSGHSEPDAAQASWENQVDALVSAGGAGLYVGYSLGARLVLGAVAAGHAEVLGAVSVGGRLGFTDSEGNARHQRQAADDALAQRIQSRSIEEFVADWLNRDFNQRLPVAHQFRALRLANNTTGLANSLRSVGYGSQPDLRPALAATKTPVLGAWGQQDLAEVMAHGQQIAQLGAQNSRLEIAAVGHSSCFEMPADRFAQIVADYARALL